MDEDFTERAVSGLFQGFDNCCKLQKQSDSLLHAIICYHFLG